MQIKSVLIAAIGGQGGNILAEWVFMAASLAGHLAQSVGLPGLAQRGGATMQYLEIAIAENGARPQGAVFCQMPVQGQVDVVVAQELLEMGRVLQRGYASPEATVVTSTHRDYTVFEKMPMGGAVADREELEAAGRALAKQYISLDVTGLIREKQLNPLSGNALLLGALAASGALPIQPEHYAQAIRDMGLATEMNLRAFEVGRDYVRAGGHQVARQELAQELEPVKERAERLPEGLRDGFRRLADPLIERYGESLGRTLVEAVYQLSDYQGLRYANSYLTRVAALYQKERTLAPDRAEPAVTHTFARNLATLMTYEDAVRVAEFKTREGRFARIKAQLDVGPDQIYQVTDYLKPDAEEIYGIFPWWLVTPVLPLLNRLRVTEDREGKPRYLKQTPQTTTLPGYLTLKFLTLFKPVRQQSWRYRRERAFQRDYESWVHQFLEIDYELAVLVADAGQMVRGYGNTRRRTFVAVRTLVDDVLIPLMERDRRAGHEDYRLTRQVGQTAVRALKADEHGVDLARSLARRVLEKYDQMPYEALIAEVRQATETLSRPIAVSMREIAIV